MAMGVLACLTHAWMARRHTQRERLREREDRDSVPRAPTKKSKQDAKQAPQNQGRSHDRSALDSEGLGMAGTGGAQAWYCSRELVPENDVDR